MIATYVVQSVDVKTGNVSSLIGLIAAESADAAIARAAELMDYESAAEMAADYAAAAHPQLLRAEVTDKPATYV